MELKAAEKESYVRERWEHISIEEYGATIIWSAGLVVKCSPSNNPDWHAAYAFTVAREEEIRQVEEEIAEMEDYIGHSSCLDHVWCVRRRCRKSRILARLQAALEELQRGMRGYSK